MIYASFGIKIFFDRDLLLTENFELVHYGKGTRGESTIDSPSDIYFYIRDEQICKERDDANYVINVINLTKIPIYQGNNPEFRLWKDDYVRKELIDNSTVCLYYFYDDNKIKFFLHYAYKDESYERELDERILSLLKYTWFTSRQVSITNYELIGENFIQYVQEFDVKDLINTFHIVSGEKTFYGRDSESTHFGERFIINTKDPYIIFSLLNITNTLYPRSYSNNTTYMYGEKGAKEYKLFNKSNIDNEINIEFLQLLIDEKMKNYDCRDCIKYIIIRNRCFNWSPKHTLSIQCVSFDSECILEDKTKAIAHKLLEIYSKEKHISSYFYFLERAVNVPSELLNPVLEEFFQWRLNDVLNSGLYNLTIYWSAKEICKEFNNRSNDRFNFKLDFSNCSTSKHLISGDDFDWDAYEKS